MGQVYLAKILVFSELASIFQSIVNVHGGGVSYLNLIVFFILCIPFLTKVNFTISEVFAFFFFLMLLVLKIFFQGVGEYYQKALVLLLLLPFYFVLAKRTSMVAIADECYKYRKLILILGLVYVISWFFLGTYRNASTVTVFIMLVLAYKNIVDVTLSLIFAWVMKTQYKIWALVSVGSSIFGAGLLRKLLLFLMGFGAVFIPIVLVYIDISWANFNASELSSLEERLREVRAFIVIMESSVSHLFFGWPVGQSIDNEGLSDRGYMHSAYLWLLGVMGLPFSVFLFVIIFMKGAQFRKFFLIRSFLILSNAFTFLLLTNPLCTALMLADECKENN